MLRLNHLPSCINSPQFLIPYREGFKLNANYIEVEAAILTVISTILLSAIILTWLERSQPPFVSFFHNLNNELSYHFFCAAHSKIDKLLIKSRQNIFIHTGGYSSRLRCFAAIIISSCKICATLVRRLLASFINLW